MDNFITLSCPNCGGNLILSPNTSTMKCNHCNSDHIVREGSNGFFLEAFAKCPICMRNDKVEKVSTIVSSQTSELIGVTIEKRTYTDNDGYHHTTNEKVPFSGSQSSLLAKRLSPAPPPIIDESHVASNIYYFIMGFWIFFGVISSWMIITLPMSIGLGYLFWWLGKNKRIEEDKRIKEQEQKVEYHKKKWKRYMPFWNKLYYCYRDDRVFFPGQDYFAISEKMEEFLSRFV